MVKHVIELEESFRGDKYNYIYLIYRLGKNGFLYIGQTGQTCGVIGRLYQHLCQKGSLVKRAKKRGIDISSKDITLEYFLLKEDIFSSPSYRESLEVVIHNFIPQISSIEIISNIRYNNDAYTQYRVVQDFLKQIENRLKEVFLYDKCDREFE